MIRPARKPPTVDSPADAIIAVDKLSVRFGAKTVLRDVSFSVTAGEVFVILGGSGSGKTTLLKQMIGLSHPTGGSIAIEGRRWDDTAPASRMALLRRIGVLYQSAALFGGMTALENVALPLREFTDLPPEAVLAIARSKLGLVGLSDAAERFPNELSGGMQKRVGLARALALDPAILFLDEPSAGLDPITSADLDRLIMDLNQALGVTFVIVSHELASILTIADRVLMLDHGGVAAIGDPHHLQRYSSNPWVRRFFAREVSADHDQGNHG